MIRVTKFYPGGADLRGLSGALSNYGSLATDNAYIASQIVAKVAANAAYALARVNLLGGGEEQRFISDMTNGTIINWDMGSYGWAAARIDKDIQSMAKWSTTFLRWAVNGQRDDGTPYSWAMWYDYAKTLLSDLNYQIGTAADYSETDALIRTIKETVTTPFMPTKWPWWWWLGVAGAGFYIYSNVSAQQSIISFLKRKK